MDVTGKPEDEVATALFDAGWDESRAIGKLLLFFLNRLLDGDQIVSLTLYLLIHRIF